MSLRWLDIRVALRTPLADQAGDEEEDQAVA